MGKVALHEAKDLMAREGSNWNHPERPLCVFFPRNKVLLVIAELVVMHALHVL